MRFTLLLTLTLCACGGGEYVVDVKTDPALAAAVEAAKCPPGHYYFKGTNTCYAYPVAAPGVKPPACAASAQCN